MAEDLDHRKKRILQAIVEEYIETAEPVSSKNLVEELDCSSATIRNDMAELEHIGFLEKTHTSSGRIPSQKGYRYYVDQLIRDDNLTKQEMELIEDPALWRDITITGGPASGADFFEIFQRVCLQVE